MTPSPSGTPAPLRSRPAREVAAVLQQAALFAGLSEPALQALARASSLRRVPKGQVLFSQDDAADSLYLVHTGCILISLATADGRELVINEMRPGDFFGEVALLQGHTRSANAVAREASEVLCLPGDLFLAQLENEPRVARQLLQTLADRLRVSGERESALAFLAAPARLARLLLQRSAIGVSANAEPLVTISQEEIAQHLGLTRQTVAKILGGWRRAGWIITGRGRIMLVDQAAVKRLAREGVP
jgi:CRP-like cAMP-binding protein